jgi:hypothetical protein
MRFDIWATERESAEVIEHGLKVVLKETPFPAAMLWNPKSTKPVFNYRFRTVEQRDDYVANYVTNYGAQQAAKTERRKSRAEGPDNAQQVKVGTIFVNSWGWEQTNVDFYEVVRKSGQMVEVRPIASESVPGSTYSHGMAQTVTPAPGAFITKSYRLAKRDGSGYKTSLNKRVQYTERGDAYLSFDHGWCGVYDGRPMYESWYA